jgi:hypothetical protein
VLTAEPQRLAILAALAEAAAPTMPSGIRKRFQTRLKNEHVLAGDGILLRESGVLIARTEAMEWQPGPFSGIWVKLLFFDQQQQRTTSLVRLEPGTSYPRHRHNGSEEIFLLDGDFAVEGLILVSGDYCNAQAASTHGESYTKTGCMFILSACQLDQVLH